MTISKEERAELRDMMIPKEERVELRAFLGSSVRRSGGILDGLSRVLDALDAADERIARLNEIHDDQHREAYRLKARITELKAAAQWRPIEDAPRDGRDWLIVARAGTWWRAPAYWRGPAYDGCWCQSDQEELHFTPTHFCELPDAPALPEGGV